MPGRPRRTPLCDGFAFLHCAWNEGPIRTKDQIEAIMPKHIGIGLLVAEGFQVMGLAALSVFEMANRVLEYAGYDVHVISEHGGPVRNSLGFAIETKPFPASFHDTTVTIGSLAMGPTSPGHLDYLNRAVGRSRRIAGVCTGAFALAEAGLLNGRRATTHWAHAARLQAEFPAIKVDADRIFINDGGFWTSAGMSSAMDMALALVEEDFGQEIARTTARRMVLYLRRPGGQSQFSTLVEVEPKTDRIRRVLAYAKENLAKDLSIEELAQFANLSVRQFSRLFRNETGQTPAKVIETLRLEAARLLMEEGRFPLDEIAQLTGFADRERMRRAFVRSFGQSPQVVRRRIVQDRQTSFA